MTTQKTGVATPLNGKPSQPANPLKAVQKVEETPLEKKLRGIQKILELQTRHNRLLCSERKLDEFVFVKGEENIELTLSDEHNRTVQNFATQNPEVVAGVMAVLKTTIQNKRKAVEAELLAAAA